MTVETTTTSQTVRVRAGAPCAICHKAPPTTTVEIVDQGSMGLDWRERRTFEAPCCYSCRERYSRFERLRRPWVLIPTLAATIAGGLLQRYVIGAGFILFAVLGFLAGGLVGFYSYPFISHLRFGRPLDKWLDKYTEKA
jgi:hypothetical protein